MATQPPPPYQPNGEQGNKSAAPATNLPGQPIAMQPMGQPGMDTSGQKVTPLHLMSEVPEWVDCQMCQQRTRTRIEKKGEGMQFLTGALLCLVCICLAPLPCCLHWFEQTNWYCDKCGKQIATRTPESPVHVLPPPHALSVPSQYGGQQPPHGQGPQGPPPPPHVNPQAGGMPPHGQAPMSPPVGSPYAGTPPAGPPGGSPVPIEHQHNPNPEITQAPLPAQTTGGPDSVPMKN
ncbi:uncharacterized protein F5Z01DRAFT_266098 [Emericellopsis atlantica]|uniref:LITAF domain-containing protein n=1 Tax=Emericellopsis atlantica TaxID=2614577 RepID=A0A9P7ZHH5_9HYPO|nr:uncharacterized protein F5Z01DRAFT_266098 [Emericellopsis atlantica]KAG9251777.1 hypothetical protein F5Z01DRAFT_266098 [Emericellopsis atlantica]